MKKTPDGLPVVQEGIASAFKRDIKAEDSDLIDIFNKIKQENPIVACFIRDMAYSAIEGYNGEEEASNRFGCMISLYELLRRQASSGRIEEMLSKW